MHNGNNFGRPCAKISRKIYEENVKNNGISQNKRKKIEPFIEINKKENSRLFEHKAYSSADILLI